VDASGNISTYAGNGTASFSGDGSQATAAELNNPYWAVMDNSGNLYISDQTNRRVRKVNSSGTISTFAGNGMNGNTGNGGAATAAELNGPIGLAFDASGNLYIADAGNSNIRKVINAAPVFVNGSSQNITVCENSSAVSINTYLGITDDWPDITETWSVTATASQGTVSPASGTGSYTTLGTTLNPTGFTYTPNTSYTGTDAFTITVSDGYLTSSIEFKVSVVTPGTISGPSNVCIGANICLSSSGTTGGTWSSSATSVATANSTTGVVTGMGVGGATITYSFGSGCSTTATVATSICGVTTIAGNGTAGYGGDGGAATAATFDKPGALVFDGSGNIYVADGLNFCVRKINSVGIITTIVGDGINGYSGDGGQATAAKVSGVKQIAIDGSGNMFIADAGNNVIREINSSGIISTVAGNGTAGFSGDGGNATNAELNSPLGVGIDNFGNIIIADNNNQTIRMVNPSGIITTIAGTPGTSGYSGDGGNATMAKLSSPQNIITDISGNIYISEGGNDIIRIINSSGIIRTFAGNGTSGYSGDGSAATNAEFSLPIGMSIDCSGNFFIADANNNVIRKINTSNIVSTIVGNGTSGYSGNGGAATAALMSNPNGVAIDENENIYVGEIGNQIIRKIGPGLCNTCRFGSIQNSKYGESVQENQYTLFPNPSTGTIFINQTFEEKGTIMVNIINFVGQVIFSKNFEFITGTAEVDIADVKPGIYFVELKDDKGRIKNYKLIIER